MIETLNRIRAKPEARLPFRQKLARLIFSFFLGAFLGLLAKYLDNVPLLGIIGTLLGVWILAATLLAAWSRSPEAAALHVLVFFAAMLFCYYLYSTILFGFFPKYYFLAWGGIALFSPIGAYAVWYARGDGWIAAGCASLPIALLLVEGYHFFSTGWIPHGLDVLAALFLIFALGGNLNQRLRILAVALVVFLVFQKLHILSLVFGGL